MNNAAFNETRQPVPVVIVKNRGIWVILLLLFLLIGSIFLNFVLGALFAVQASGNVSPLNETFHSGDEKAKDKIALLVTDFTIMPPYTKRFLKTIKEIEDKDDVKGVVLVIDSPGGLVSDSHEIYHRLLELSKKKKIYVSMKGIAASGGYYIAMGAGEGAPIFAEPTTWTGSIGVIMPRYNARELGEKIGVKSEPLTTGPLKDTLNPLKELTEQEREVWDVILDDSYHRFLEVIDHGRSNLNLEQVKALATGQIYTANQALANGLVDQIGYQEDAIEALKKELGLEKAKVVEYSHPLSFADMLLGASARMKSPDPLSMLIDASVPRAMYMFGWPKQPSYFPEN